VRKKTVECGCGKGAYVQEATEGGSGQQIPSHQEGKTNSWERESVSGVPDRRGMKRSIGGALKASSTSRQTQTAGKRRERTGRVGKRRKEACKGSLLERLVERGGKNPERGKMAQAERPWGGAAPAEQREGALRKPTILRLPACSSKGATLVNGTPHMGKNEK